jgi:hypothetical protein
VRAIGGPFSASAAAFEANRVDGPTLLMADAAALMAVGVDNAMHRTRLLSGIATLRMGLVVQLLDENKMFAVDVMSTRVEQIAHPFATRIGEGGCGAVAALGRNDCLCALRNSRVQHAHWGCASSVRSTGCGDGHARDG